MLVQNFQSIQKPGNIKLTPVYSLQILIDFVLRLSTISVETEFTNVIPHVYYVRYSSKDVRVNASIHK